MRALRFRLKGKNAFFRNPEVNTYFQFTYGNIHKPVLLGIFGAILGYPGYASASLKRELSEKKEGASYPAFPEYYCKLRELKLSIKPDNEDGYWPRKKQSFNNSVGYASGEAGGNLIVTEEWLEDPGWTIYVLLDGGESEKLAEYILGHKAVFIPYLGTNDHPADIVNAEIIELNELGNCDAVGRLNCLAPEDDFEFDWFGEDVSFKNEEYLPIRLKESTNLYEYVKFVYTDAEVTAMNRAVYTDGDNSLTFY